ncbi:MAG: hypothetical protein LQ343_005936 [Gyalolechia ehrenbergii]|nr:MAG: hypothetical protein LQ343_005936 [Gyalolechia ehrenbergii]
MARDKVEDEELNDHEKPYTNRSPTSSEDFGANGEKGDPSRRQSVINTKLQNPLSGMSYEELMDDVSLFAKQYDLQYAEDDLQKGALIAQKRSGFENMDRLTDEDKSLIREEKLHRWRQPRMMYYMTIGGICFLRALLSALQLAPSLRQHLSTLRNGIYGCD